MSRRLSRVTSVLCTSILMCSANAVHAVQWSGGSASSSNWSDSLNWYLFDRPDDGSSDSVTFYSDTARTTSTINQDYAIGSLYFDAGYFGDQGMTLNGTGTLGLKSGIDNESGSNQTISAPIRVDQSCVFKCNGGGELVLSGGLNLNGKTMTFEPTDGTISVSGAISGSGNLTLNAAGVLNLTASNSFSGAVTLKAGTLQFNSGPNLGAVSNNISFNQSGSSSVPTLQRNGSGTTSGAIDFSSGSNPAGTTVTVTGAFSGGGTFGKTGDGTLILSGNSGFNGITGPTGSVHVYAGTLEVAGQPRLPTSRISVDGSATLKIDDGIVNLIGALEGAGSLQLGNGAGLNIGVPLDSNVDHTGNGTFSGVIGGNNASVFKQGTGTLVVTNSSNAYSGTTTIANGAFVADNTGGGSATGTSTVFVQGAGTLAGDGTIIGNVTLKNGATIAPSNALTPGSNLGSLNLAGLTEQAGSTTSIQLSNGGGNDSVIVSGNASLAGTLALSRILNINLTSYGVHEVMHVNGVITGTFGAITGNVQSPTSYLAVTYAPHSVYVTLARPGDDTLDGSVDFNDLLILAKHYNTTSGNNWTTADFDGNGTVDFNDLLLMAKNYGTSVAGGSATLDNSALPTNIAADWTLARSLVPEPTLLALVAGVSIVSSQRGRRATRV